MNSNEKKLRTVWWVLRIGLGTGVFLAGLDKFFNILTDWSMYLSPLAEKMLPVSVNFFMRAMGVIEMIVGLVILIGPTSIGAYIAMLWLWGIAVNLLTTGMFRDLAVRDVEMSLGAFALARISEIVRDLALQPEKLSGRQTSATLPTAATSDYQSKRKPSEYQRRDSL